MLYKVHRIIYCYNIVLCDFFYKDSMRRLIHIIELLRKHQLFKISTDRRNPISMRLVARPMLPHDVRRNPQGS